MANNTDIILNIQVEYEDAINNIARYQKTVDAAKDANNKLKKELREGKICQDAYNKAVASNRIVIDQANNAIRINRKEIMNNIATQTQQDGSLKSLRASLSNTTRAYDELSRVEREGAKGKDLLNKIKNIQTELTAAEEASKRFQRNVGNYKSINADLIETISVINPKLGRVLQKLQSVPALANAFGKATEFMSNKLNISSTAAAGLQFAIIGLVVGGIMYAIDYYKKWNKEKQETRRLDREISEALKSSNFGSQITMLKKLQGEWNNLGNNLQAKKKFIDENKDSFADLGVSVTKVSDAEKIFNKNTNTFIESLKQRARASAAYELAIKKFSEAFQKEEEARIKTMEAEAVRGKNASQFPASYVVDTRYGTSAQNNMATNVANGIEAQAKTLLSEAESIYKDGERLFNIYADESLKSSNTLNSLKLEQSNDHATEVTKKIADLTRFRLEQEIQSEKDIYTNQEKSYQDRLNALNNYQNLQRAYILKDKEFQLAQAGLTADQKQLIEEKSNAKLLALDKELSDSSLKLMQENDAKVVNAANININNKLAVSKKGSENELSLQLQQLNLQYQEEIKNAEKTGADKLAIYNKYQKLRNDAEEKQKQYIDQQQQIEYQNQILQEQKRLDAEQQTNDAIFALRIQAKQAEIDNLRQMDEESDIEFFNRKLLLQQQLKGLEEERSQWLIDNEQMTLSAISTLAGGVSDFLEQMGEQSEAFAEFSKAVALFQIGVDTAAALSAGIAASQKSTHFPANLAAIATTVAAILSNIAKAKKYLTSAKQPKTPSFATGGLVTGPGSGTSDSIQANISNGESILTARATAMFSPILSAFNQVGGGVPISTQDTSAQVMGEEMLARAFSKAVQLLPNPVVSVQEISNTNNRVSVLESSTNL